MAIRIGGIAPFPGANNTLLGTGDPDVIFGDPYTQGNPFGITAADAVLDSGTRGSDTSRGRADYDELVGDAWIATGSAYGGNDVIYGEDGGAHAPVRARCDGGCRQTDALLRSNRDSVDLG
jgi:hypothetical protein